MVITATNVNAAIFAKKKSGRTCIVCKQQMAWSDGHMVEFKNQLDADGKILAKWEKNGTIKQLMGAINSVGEGRSQIISETDWNDIALIK